MITIYLIVLLFSIENTSTQPLAQLCSTVNFLNQTDRNINATCNNCSKQCDTGVYQSWYAFKRHAKIPSFCLPVGTCQTDTPYWTPDSHPDALNPGPINMTLCYSTSLTGNDSDCTTNCTLKIQAAFCQKEDLMIYEFLPPPGCNMRYCYHEEIPCAPGESSLSGFKPCQTIFPFQLFTNGTTGFITNYTHYLLYQKSGIYAKCTIKCPQNQNCQNVNGDVYWYSGNEATSFQKSSLFYDHIFNELYGYLNESQWDMKINSFIFCRIIPRVNGLRPYSALYTEPYYFGLFLQVIQPSKSAKIYNYYNNNEIRIELDDVADNTAKLVVHSTIPILCQSGNQCNVLIQLNRFTQLSSNLLNLVTCAGCNSGCGKQLNPQYIEDKLNNVSFDIITAVEAGNSFKAESLKVELVGRSVSNPIGQFWNGLLLPLINVLYLPVNAPMKRYAYSLNDPHLKTFDNHEREFHTSGEYLMYENNDTLTRIHSVNKPCESNGVYCNYQIFIQTVDDVVEHNIDFPDSLFYTDVSNPAYPLRYKVFFDKDNNGIIMKQNAVIIKKVSNGFRIITNFATIVDIDYLGNYYIFPSKYDKANINGIFGNFNSLDYDENDLPTGVVANSESDVFTYYNVLTRQRPMMSAKKFYTINNNNNNQIMNTKQYCACTNDSNIGCSFGNVARAVTQKIGPFGKRDVESLSKIPYHLDKSLFLRISKKMELLENNNHNVIQKNVLFKRALKDKCVEVLNTTELQVCDNLKLINLTMLIELCKLDFNMTGSDHWALQYHNSAQSICRTILLKDKNTYVNKSGNLIPDETILSKLCPNNCTGHGSCSLGSCICQSGYDGDDCSIDLSTQPIIYNSSVTKNICNIQNESFCNETLFHINRFSKFLSIEYKTYYRDANGSYLEIDRGKTSEIYRLTDNVIYAPFQITTNIIKGASSVLYIRFTASDQTKSNSFSYTIIDSNCHYCTDVNNCDVLGKKCNINNKCYNDGDPNPSGTNEKCDSTRNKYAWTIRSVDNTSASNSIYIISNWILCILISIISFIQIILC